MADVSAELLDRNHLAGEDIAWLEPHQASKRIIDATADYLGLSHDKVMLCLLETIWVPKKCQEQKSE